MSKFFHYNEPDRDDYLTDLEYEEAYTAWENAQGLYEDACVERNYGIA